MTRNLNGTWTSDALQRGDVDAIRQRVLDDANYLTTRDDVGTTPLQAVIEVGNLELVQFLLQNGANPNVDADDGYTCLLTAIECDSHTSQGMVAALVAASADIHQPGTSGWTPLHMAAARGHAAIASLLLDAGARVDLRKEIDAEETPLMEAAFSGRPETVQLLLDHGADASLRDTIHNRTSLEIAQDTVNGPNPEVCDQLKEQDFMIDVADMFEDMELPLEQMRLLKQSFENLDMVETYMRNSKEIVEAGDHAAVIRILTKHQSQQ